MELTWQWIPPAYRDAVFDLLLLGDEDANMLNRYWQQGDLLAALVDAKPVGVALCVPVEERSVELKNLAVAPAFQRQGIGTALIA